jgi:outer membrane cobalamin receptor
MNKSLSAFPTLILLLMLVGLVVNHQLIGQTTDSANIFKPTVQEILQLPIKNSWATNVEIASKKQQSIEEAPAIVTVITQEDIKKYGARDIADVLRWIPNFEFGIDVQTMYGVGFRGAWGHEGKVLLMIDGMSINCFGYGNTNFFGTLPLQMVERIEIIRGPGSALYGGFAEVAVINVITKHGQQLKGVEVQTQAGTLKNNLLYGISGSAGTNFSDKQLNISTHIGMNYTPLSDRAYQDYNGNQVDFGAKNSWRYWTHYIAKIDYKRLNISYNRTQMRWVSPDEFGTITTPNGQGDFTNIVNTFTENIMATYHFLLRKKIKISPKIEYNRGNPLTTKELSTTDLLSENQTVIGRRYLGEMTVQYDFTDKIHVDFGGGYTVNTIQGFTRDGNPTLKIGTNAGDTTSFLSKSSTYLFLQYLHNLSPFHLSIGGRYENTPFGDAFAPRLALNYVKSKFHAKLLYGRAFRVPLLWQTYSRQYFSGEKLAPETSETIEGEIGYRLNTQLKATVNAFYVNIASPITYIGATDSYQNYGNLQSLGVEAETQLKFKNWGGFLNFSYAVPTQNTSQEFVAQGKKAFLGLPTFKTNLNVYYSYKKFSLATTCTYLSSREAQTAFSALNSTTTNVIFETASTAPIWLQNFNLNWNEPIKSLYLQIGVYNVWNSDYFVLQPYYGGHAPTPANDRQWLLSVMWKW